MKQTTYLLNGEECHPLNANEVHYEFYKGAFKESSWHGKGELTTYLDKKFSKKYSSYKGQFIWESFDGYGEYTEYDKMFLEFVQYFSLKHL